MEGHAEYSANIIAKNMSTQCKKSDGNGSWMMTVNVDYRSDATAVEFSDCFGTVNGWQYLLELSMN